MSDTPKVKSKVEFERARQGADIKNQSKHNTKAQNSGKWKNGRLCSVCMIVCEQKVVRQCKKCPSIWGIGTSTGEEVQCPCAMT